MVSEHHPVRWVRDCRDAVVLGVHPVRQAADTVAMPAYVRRDVTPGVAMALRKPGMVVIEGPAASGKSRVAFEAMRGLRSSHRLIVPRTLAEVRKLGELGDDLSNTVIWLDSVERHLSSGALDALVRRLVHRSARSDVTLIATLNPDLVGEVSWAGGSHSHDSDDPLAQATVIQLSRDLSPAERSAAEQHRRDPRVAAFLDQGLPGFAAHLAGAPEAVRRWRAGRAGRHRVGGAIVSAAVLARRSGYLGADVPGSAVGAAP